MNSSTTRRFLLVAVCIGLVATLSLVIGLGSSVFDQLDLLVDIRHEIIGGYVEEPDQPKMVEAAVRAMVDSLDDPYTVYLSPEELEPFDKHVRGTFSGIGAEIDTDDGHIRIVSPLEDSPAWRAGIMAGDTILEINGESTLDMSLIEAVKRLTGQAGTDVTIKIRHLGGEEVVITITRAVINIQTVKGIWRNQDLHPDYMLDPERKIGYVRVTQFTEGTSSVLQQAMQDLTRQGMRGLIMDLRFNPGGLLDAAVEVADLFLESGKTIVSTRGRATPEHVFTALTPPLIPDIPIVVLGNESSASASEIVAGALADNGRAKFIGTRTFGKGSAQQVKMLENEQGAIKITHSYWYMPSGRNIHRKKDAEVWGVDPEDGFYVPMTIDEMKKMLETRRDHDISDVRRAEQNGWQITPQWIEQKLADPQLAAGFSAILGKLDTGTWPVVGLSGADELAKKTKRDTLLKQQELLAERLKEIETELQEMDNPSSTQPATQPVDEEASATQPATQPDKLSSAPSATTAPATTAPADIEEMEIEEDLMLPEELAPSETQPAEPELETIP